MSLEPLELALVPPSHGSPCWSPGCCLAVSPSELPGKVRSRRRGQTVWGEGPGTTSLARGREILSRWWCWSDRGLGNTGTTDISELLTAGLTLTQSDGLLTPARTPRLAGPTDIIELGTGGVTLPGPDSLQAPGGTGGRWRRCRGGDGRRRDVHWETLSADVDVGVTGGVTLA